MTDTRYNGMAGNVYGNIYGRDGKWETKESRGGSKRDPVNVEDLQTILDDSEASAVI